MQQIMDAYIHSKDSAGHEFEFEAQIVNKNTKIDYNSVIEQLLRAGFTLEDHLGVDLLRIIMNEKEGTIRIEIAGIGAIKTYCRTQQLVNPKFYKKHRLDKKSIPEYWTNLTLSKESAATEDAVDLDRAEKTFRFMNRVRLSHNDKEKYPFVYDCSIVRTSDLLKNLFTVKPAYEIEVEFERHAHLKQNVQHAITLALRGFQRSSYPISLTEMNAVRAAYLHLIKTDKFIGPKSITLQKDHLNLICNDFSVTDKADGERKLLFYTGGRIYFITAPLLGVEFTGSVCDAALNGTLLDGEHITKNKQDALTNMFVAFDLYFYKNKDYRSYRLQASPEHRKEYDALDRRIHSKKTENKEELKKEQAAVKKLLFSRLGTLENIITDTVGALTFVLSHKTFMPCTTKNCSDIMTKPDYEYHTDGLIFTPTSLGVGAVLGEPYKAINDYFTWQLSFKWKPAKDNTIDFKISFDSTEHYVDLKSYALLKLSVGFNPRYDVIANPKLSIFNGYEIHPPKAGEILFKPGNPADKYSHVSKVESINGIVRTEQGEILEPNMIVEFWYNTNNVDDMKWIPLRVRWDKMSGTQMPNSFTTAASNWHTIQNPIRLDELGIKSSQVNYYAEKTAVRTGLQNFHNEVKKQLLGIIKPNDKVIDFAVGPGGDLQKWLKAGFVLGIDIDENNIINPEWGVCARYIKLCQEKTKTKHKGHIPKCIFVQGNSSLHIKSGTAMPHEHDKTVVQYLFGDLDRGYSIEEGVKSHYSIAKHGFNVASIQFAVHYMFKNIKDLTHFIQNVAECTRVGGHFVGTCYDGEKVFKQLQETPVYDIKNGDSSICKITKKYVHADLNMRSCLGYTIGVYQTIIGTEHDEYLVFFPYFIHLMNSYGFKLENRTNFEDIYATVHDKKFELTVGEKQLSFLNTTFTFIKERDVSPSITKEGYINIKPVSLKK